MYLLWDIMGPAVLAGLGVMILLIPINGVIASIQRKLQVLIGYWGFLLFQLLVFILIATFYSIINYCTFYLFHYICIGSRSNK